MSVQPLTSAPIRAQYVMSRTGRNFHWPSAQHELPLLFAIFLDLAGFGMAFPDLQLRAEKFAIEVGVAKPGLLIGLLLSSYFAVQLVASPKWGILSDRIGRKPVLLVCTALSCSSMLMYAFSGSIWGILASRILAGLAAANVVVAQAYIADTSTDEDRTPRQGRVSAAILAGLVAGPAIGGELAHRGGNYLLGLVAAGASFSSLIWIYLAIPRGLKPAGERRPGRPPVIDLRLLKEFPALRRIFFYGATGWFVLACLEGTFGRLIEHNLGFGQQQFGWIFSYESLLGAGVGIVLAWITRRMREQNILRLGYLLEAVGLGLTPLAPGLAALFAASTLYALGLGFVNPTINGISSHLAPESRQGEMFGLLQGSRSLGFLVGPLLGGVLFDIMPALPYLVAAAVALALSLFVRM
jgi:MFS family permease